MTPFITHTYDGSSKDVADYYCAHANKMAADGYVPLIQSWAPNSWGLGRIIIAFLLCLVGIGFILLFQMMADAPGGTLTVMYRHNT